MVEMSLSAIAVTCVINRIQLSFILHSGLQQLNFQMAGTRADPGLVGVAWQCTGARGFQRGN